MSLTSTIYTLVPAVFLGLLALAVKCDVREYRIPNRIPLAIILLFPAWATVPGAGVDLMPSLALAGVVLLAGLALFAAGYMGGGDIKLIVAVTPWVGIAGFPMFLLVMGLTGSALAFFQSSRVRLGIAMALPAGSREALRSLLLGGDIPYAVAIAAGAAAGLGAGPFAQATGWALV